MKYISKLLIEASFVGLSIVIFGTIISYIIAMMEDKNTKFLKNISMYIALFLIGFILHIIYDIAGLNRWYCKNCAGCK